MEPYNIHPHANPDSVRIEALVSIAVSLKRIADMMEGQTLTDFVGPVPIFSASADAAKDKE